MLATALALPAAAADRSKVTVPVAGQPYFFQLAPIFVPVIARDNSISRQVSMAVALEIADGGEVQEVEKKRRLLDDAFLRDTYAFVQQRGGVGMPQGEAALKDRLRQTARAILGPDLVSEVMIEQFFEQQR